MNITPEVITIGQINITGNVTPPVWHQHLKYKNGKPNAIAVTLLAEIVYWYRPTEIRDEKTGLLKELRKKFKADKLQRSYASFAKQFGFTKIQVRDALKFLQEKGIITLEFRTVTLEDGQKLGNVLFIGIVPKRIVEISAPPLCSSNSIGGQSELDTNTETSTEIVLEETIVSSAADAPACDPEPESEISPVTEEKDPEPENAPPANDNGKCSAPDGVNLKKLASDLAYWFQERTQLPFPTGKGRFKALNVLWWTPLTNIAKICDFDVQYTQELIDWAIKRADAQKLTVSSPASIEKIAVGEQCQRLRNQDDGRTDADQRGTGEVRRGITDAEAAILHAHLDAQKAKRERERQEHAERG